MTAQAGVSHLSPTYRVRNLFQGLNVTFWLQVAILATAAASVQSAGWVESPPLALIAFLGALAALLPVDLKERTKTYHALSLLAGGLLAYLGGIYLTEADQWYLRFGELNSRLAEWWSAIVGNDATTDSLPLSITIIAIIWVVAYLTSWALFKHRNVWAVLLPVGMGVVINLTYLPERFSIYLFVFLFFGLMMLAHMNSVNMRALFQAQGTPHPTSLHRLSLAHGLLLSAVILGITVVAPIGEDPASPLEWVFEPVDRMVDGLQDELYRIFGAVPSHDPSSIRFFGSVLPLLRPVPTDEDPILFSSARYPLYWPAVAYDEYTGKAWKVEETMARPMISVGQETVDEEEEGLAGVAYTVEMHVNSPYLMVAGNVVDMRPNAQQNIPAPKSFRVDMANTEENWDLPEDMQRLAVSLNASSGASGNPEVWSIPQDMVVTEVIKDESPSGGRTTTELDTETVSYYSDLRQALEGPGRTVGLEVERLPEIASTVSIEPFDRLEEGSQYSVTSQFVYASEEAMRSALDVYPPGIRERYLEVPSSLPDRVSALASDLTSGATNPYDKAVAVEAYLRGLEYTVAQQDIPHDADTVDYFLFESGEGFSDYFASSMAIMLRIQGIPTRLVLGFGFGEVDPDAEGFMVRDKDSHSWPEVYFGEVGWVPFEPTPIYPLRSRSLPASPFAIDSLSATEGSGELSDLGGSLDPLADDTILDESGGPLSGGDGPKPLPVRYFGTPLGLGGGLFLLFVVIGVVLLRVLWMRQYGRLGTGQTVYERVYRLVGFLGFPPSRSQTALEFSQRLSALIPEVREEVNLVSRSFVRETYGGIRPTAMEEIRLVWSWRRIKRALSSHLKQVGEAAPAG